MVSSCKSGWTFAVASFFGHWSMPRAGLWYFMRGFSPWMIMAYVKQTLLTTVWTFFLPQLLINVNDYSYQCSSSPRLSSCTHFLLAAGFFLTLLHLKNILMQKNSQFLSNTGSFFFFSDTEAWRVYLCICLFGYLSERLDSWCSGRSSPAVSLWCVVAEALTISGFTDHLTYTC